MIIQGRHDTRTPARPIELDADTLKVLDKPLNVHWFKTGHKEDRLYESTGLTTPKLLSHR